MATPFSNINLNSLKNDIRTNTSNIINSENALSQLDSEVVKKTDTAYGFTTYTDTTKSYDVDRGNPTATIPDDKGGEMSELKTDITTDKTNAKLLIQISIYGEWDGDEHNKGIMLFKSQANDGSPIISFLRSSDTTGGAAQIIQPFAVSVKDNDANCGEVCNILYVDSVSAIDTYSYTPILVSTSDGTGTDNFTLNRTQGSGARTNERGVSTICIHQL